MIYLGADHRGYELKEKIKQWLKEWGYKYEDCGNKRYEEGDDFPDFAFLVAEKVAKELESRGILICGTGVGMDIAANRVRDVRSVLGLDEELTKKARRADNVNILSLPSYYLENKDLLAQKIIKAFLETEASGEEKYQRRLEKIEKYETSKTPRF